jgi:glycosyltransferase involved in cell wall biosynthesis
MPCYNAAKHIAESIDCVLRQNWPNVELIVVDDGSTDESVAIIERYGNQVTLLRQNNQGPFPARNRGLSKAHGKYISFLDADDWWKKDFLEKMVTTLEKNHADLSYCGWQNVGEHVNHGKSFIPPAYEERDIVATFLRDCPWPIHAAVIKRSAVTAIHGFSEQHFSSMDYDFWLRIIGHTNNIVRVPEVLAFYRWHSSTQISANKARQVINAVKVRADFVHHYPKLVNNISKDTLTTLVNGPLLKEAYRCYWARDLANARQLFLAAFKQRLWSINDLKYLIPALLPEKLYQGIIRASDSLRRENTK